MVTEDVSTSHILPQAIPDDGEPKHPEDDLVGQRWSPRSRVQWLAVLFALIETGAFVVALVFIYKPRLFTIKKSPFPKHLSIPIYNFIITLAGTFMSTINLYFWTQLCAAILVHRLGKKRINYRFYERFMYWAGGKIHLQMSISLLISLVIAAMFQSYAAAFTAAFSMNLEPATFIGNTPLLNLSANANALAVNVGTPLNSPEAQGNDFDTALSTLYLQHNQSTPTISQWVTLPIDGMNIQATDGMVLGARSGANVALFASNFSSIGIGSKDALLLSENYVANNLRYAATGVRSNTRCEVTGDFTNATYQFYSGYTIFNISTPSCGQISRIYPAYLEVAYGAYACPASDQLTIMTGILRTNASNSSLEEAMECSTMLSDARGSGLYEEIANSFTLDPGPFQYTPMVPDGVSQVLQFTTGGWIDTMGVRGSQGLLAFIQGTPLNNPTMSSNLEDAISYIYSLGGAKTINSGTQITTIRGTGSPFVYSNTTVQISSDLYQIGYGRNGIRKYLIAFLAVNVALALISAVFIFVYPPMPFDPTDPSSVILMGLNSRRAMLFNGTSVGRLPSSHPDRSWREWVVGLWRGLVSRCFARRSDQRADPKTAYEDLDFQLEVDDSSHLRLVTYGKRGPYEKLWDGSRPPIRGETYK